MHQKLVDQGLFPSSWLVQPGLQQPCRSEAAGSENWNHRFGFYAFSALGWRTKFGSIKWARKWVHFCTPILSLNKEIETWVQIWVRNMDPNLGHRTRTKNRQHCKQRAPTTLQNFPARSPGTGPRWLVQPGLRQPCRSETAGSENWNHRFGFYAFSAQVGGPNLGP